MNDRKHYIILFDGVCNLCNSFVSFVVDNANSDKIKFISLQSDEADNLLKQNGVNAIDYSTIYFLADGKLYSESSAILRIFSYLKMPYPLFRLAIIIPRFIRDYLYKVISRNRYRLFGKSDTCRIPSEKERRFFDLS